MISFVFPNRLQLITLISLCLFWVIRDVRINTQKRFQSYRWALFLSGIYFLYALSLPFTAPGDQRAILFDLEQKASLIVFPFALMLMNAQTRKAIADASIFFVYGCLFCCLLSQGIFLMQYTEPQSNPLSYMHYRGYYDQLIGIHPTYMGMYLCFAIAIVLTRPIDQPLFKGWRIVVPLFLLFLSILALMPKMPVVAMMLMLVYYGWINRTRKEKILQVASALVVAVLVVYFLLPFSSHRLNELSGFSSAIPRGDLMFQSVDMRQIILDIDLSLLQQHWLTGVGPGPLDHYLNAEYAAYSRRIHEALEMHDTHNEYFNQWLCFGLLGLFLFVALFAVQAVKAHQWHNYLYMCLLIIFSTTALTENVLSMQRGVTFYAFFSALFFFSGLQQRRKGTGSKVKQRELTYADSSAAV